MQGMPGLAHFVALCLRVSGSTRYVVRKISAQTYQPNPKPNLATQTGFAGAHAQSDETIERSYTLRCCGKGDGDTDTTLYFAEISSQNNDSPEHAVNSNPDVECISPGEILLTQRHTWFQNGYHTRFQNGYHTRFRNAYNTRFQNGYHTLF